MAERRDQNRPDPNRYRQALEKTVPAERFSADAARESLDATVGDETRAARPERYLDKTAGDTEGTRTGSSTEIGELTQGESLPPELLDTVGTAKRFELGEQVGRGATALVYAMHDHGLDRTVAVKFLRRRREDKPGVKTQFVQEARVTASLEHPNIMPVHDIGVTGEGRLYFTMKRITGCSLGDAIRREAAGEETPREFASNDGKVRIFLKICDALTYAHYRGFVHQDIKPDNIMLGEFGEVLLLDWGSALRVADGGERRLYGTPAYMSPEQARRERADERSDVYCVGSTLFHALLLRHPTWSDDPEVFWEKKREGVIDAPTREERRRAPPALIDIALKAMAVDPGERYASVAELADELKRYQAGQAVKAHRENPIEMLVRWYTHNRRMFWVAALSAGLIGGTAWLLLREKIQEMVTWRRFDSETFSGAPLGTSWEAFSSRDWVHARQVPLDSAAPWRIIDGALEGRAGAAFDNITYRRRIPGDIRVEWTATAVEQLADLNCFIAGTMRLDGYTFHVGGFGDPRGITLTKGRSATVLDRVTLAEPLLADVPYRLRMEKEGREIRFFVDGNRVLSYSDVDALSGVGHQTFGFEVNNRRHVRVDDVAVYYHPLPLKVSPLVAADQFYEQGLYREALGRYREIHGMYPEHPIAVEAQYREALCLVQFDSVDQALAVFDELERRAPRHELVGVSLYRRARIHEERGDTAAAQRLRDALLERFAGHSVLRTAVFDMSTRRAAVLRRLRTNWIEDTTADPAIPAWIERESERVQQWAESAGVPTDGNTFLEEAAMALFYAYAYSPDDLIREYPGLRKAHAGALLRRNRHERVLREYPEQRAQCAQALVEMGRWQEAFRRYPEQRQTAALALLGLGRLEDIAQGYAEQGGTWTLAQWRLGAFDAALSRPVEGGSSFNAPAAHVGVLRTHLNELGDSPLALAFCLATQAGRPDSAIAIYEARRRLSFVETIELAGALMAVGRHEEVLQRFQRDMSMEGTCAEALLRMGRFAEVRALYPAHEGIAARCHVEQGLYDSAIVLSKGEPEEHAQALIESGQWRRVLTEYPERPNLCAAALLGLGEYEQVTERYPHQREAAAKALFHLGYFDSVAARYPDQRDVCIEAIYAKGAPDVGLRRFPDSRPRYAEHLLAAGEYQQVVERFPEQVWARSRALLYLGRADEIPIDTGLLRLSGNQELDLYGLRLLRAASQGRRLRFRRLLREPPRNDYTWYHLRFARFLLGPIVQALRGDRHALVERCAELRGSHRYHYAQCLWYEAGLLSGEVTEEQFRAQPRRDDIDERTVLFTAIMAELNGDTAAALKCYRACAVSPRARYPDLFVTDAIRRSPPLFASESVRQFVKWRIRELGGVEPSTFASTSGRRD